MRHDGLVPPRRQPVARRVLFRSELLEIRDNRCGRDDPALSPATVPLAWHEVTLPRAGIWYRHLGRSALPVDSQHVHFFNRGESHRVSHPNGCGDRNTGIVLGERGLGAVLADFAPRSAPAAPFARTHVLLDSRVHAAHCVLLAAVVRSTLEPLAIDELALRLLAAIFQRAAPQCAASPPPLVRSQRDLAEAARRLLHCDLALPLSLADLAAAVGSSPFHLCRVFGAHAGMPLHRYRQLLRLRAAVEILLASEEPLAAIAAATGFHDRSHLSRVFARRIGMAPAALRRRASAALVRELLAGALRTG